MEEIGFFRTVEEMEETYFFQDGRNRPLEETANPGYL